MSALRPLVFGEVLFDLFSDGSRVLGGAPFNVAWHLQAFGCDPMFVSRVGADELGATIRSSMTRWGMSVSGLQTDAGHPTGSVEVRLQDGKPEFNILPDRAYDFIDARELPPPPSRGLVYHGSLALRSPVSCEGFEELSRRSALPIFLDVNLRTPWWEIEAVRRRLDAAHWAKVNDDELRILADRGGDLDAMAVRLRERHRLALLIVTLGEHGAAAFAADGAVLRVEPSAAVDVVDTVGAGDAFASVVILGLIRDWPIRHALARAQRFAEMVVGWRGATLPDRAPYVSLLTEWSGDEG
jgi:fructokinase